MVDDVYSSTGRELQHTPRDRRAAARDRDGGKSGWGETGQEGPRAGGKGNGTVHAIAIKATGGYTR